MGRPNGQKEGLFEENRRSKKGRRRNVKIHRCFGQKAFPVKGCDKKMEKRGENGGREGRNKESSLPQRKRSRRDTTERKRSKLKNSGRNALRGKASQRRNREEPGETLCRPSEQRGLQRTRKLRIISDFFGKGRWSQGVTNRDKLGGGGKVVNRKNHAERGFRS